MSVLPIKIYGSSVLQERAEPIAEITAEIHHLIKDMKDSLYYHQGVGLAANQIGVAKQLFIADEGKGLIVCLNPRIVQVEGSVVAEEGCLSLPEVYVDVGRSVSLTLEFLDKDGAKQYLEAKGLLARIIQHEIDHLNGIVIADRAGFIARKMIRGKLRKLQKRVQEAL